MRDFKIEFTGPMCGRVWMDGVEVQGIRSVQFSAAAKECAMVTLEVYAKTINLVGPAKVAVSEYDPPVKDGAKEVTGIGSTQKEFVRV